MRGLLPALALALVSQPAATLAQTAANPASRTERVAHWAQAMAAAQQPVVEAYELCRPGIARLSDILRTQERLTPNSTIFAEVHGGISRLEGAAKETRVNLRALPPIPAEIAGSMGLDTAALTERTIASVDSMVGYLSRLNDALDALRNGDHTGAAMRMAEARILGAEAMEGQIVLLEATRATLPMATHKSMMDIRLAISRTVQAVSLSMDTKSDAALVQKLALLRKQAGDAATALRANWQRDSAGIRPASAGETGTLHPMLVKLDEMFARVADIGDAHAELLRPAASGALLPEQKLRILDGAALLEIRSLELVQSFAAIAANK